MVSEGAVAFRKRGILRVRADDPHFQQQIREADILLAEDAKILVEPAWCPTIPSPLSDDWQESKTAVVITVQFDYETDDAQVLDQLSK
jgi:hypothetical protein